MLETVFMDTLTQEDVKQIPNNLILHSTITSGGTSIDLNVALMKTYVQFRLLLTPQYIYSRKCTFLIKSKFKFRYLETFTLVVSRWVSEEFHGSAYDLKA